MTLAMQLGGRVESEMPMGFSMYVYGNMQDQKHKCHHILINGREWNEMRVVLNWRYQQVL